MLWKEATDYARAIQQPRTKSFLTLDGFPTRAFGPTPCHQSPTHDARHGMCVCVWRCRNGFSPSLPAVACQSCRAWQKRQRSGSREGATIIPQYSVGPERPGHGPGIFLSLLLLAVLKHARHMAICRRQARNIYPRLGKCPSPLLDCRRCMSRPGPRVCLPEVSSISFLHLLHVCLFPEPVFSLHQLPVHSLRRVSAGVADLMTALFCRQSPQAPTAVALLRDLLSKSGRLALGPGTNLISRRWYTSPPTSS